MKYLGNFFVILFTATLFSCETDKSRIKSCNEIVNSFVANLTLDNYEMLYKKYPDFQKVKKYWKIYDFKITNTTIDDDKMVSVIGSSQLGNVLFNLKKVNGKYIIVNSKGLSSVFNTPLYKYCKQIGCINASDYDKDISQICSNKENEFDALVYRIKENIETNVSIQNNNLSTGYGYVSGEVTVKNYSRFSIPGRCYEIYFHFLNSNGQVVFTKKGFSNYEYIPYGQSVTEHIFEANASDFQRVRAELKLISTKFLEEVIAENVKGSNCIANVNF